MNRGLGPNAGKQVFNITKRPTGKKQTNIQKRDTTNGNTVLVSRAQTIYVLGNR